MAKKRGIGFGGAYRRGERWWIRYRHNGEQVREPGGLDGHGARTKEEAEAKLKQRFGEIAATRYVGPEAERLTVNTLLDDYESHLKNKGAKSTAQTRSHIAAVRKAFGSDRALSVTTARLREYIEEHGLYVD